MEDIDAMRQAVKTARDAASKLKIKATKARIAAQNDKKSEAKAVASTKAKDAASTAAAEVRRLERELASTERKAAKQAEKDARKAEQQAGEAEKARIAADALLASSLIEDAATQPGGREEIDWVRLADEFVAVARQSIAIVNGTWGAFDGSRWNFWGARGPALARKTAVEFYRFRPGDGGVSLRKLANGPETLLRFAQLELTRDASEFNNRARTAHLFTSRTAP